MENNITPHVQDTKCFCPNCQKERKEINKLNQEISTLRYLLNHAEKQIELHNKSYHNLWNMAYSEGYQDGKGNREHKERMEEQSQGTKSEDGSFVMKNKEDFDLSSFNQKDKSPDNNNLDNDLSEANIDSKFEKLCGE